MTGQEAFGRKTFRFLPDKKMDRKNIETFEEAEQYLYEMPRFTNKHTIKETREFLKKLGNPDLDMKIIHVAGTNGKGSVCAYLDSVLREAGIKTGLFTSPHLVDICERIRISGRDISHERFYEAFMDIYNRLDWDNCSSDDFYHPTFFEYIFFMAMQIFREEKVEWCILETGLGGLLDATNSIVTKEAAVITRIDLDHTEYLGTTRGEIAVQKAGIIAKGKPVVYGDHVPEASASIREEAKKRGAGKLYPVGPQSIKVLQKISEKVDFSPVDGYYKDVCLCLDTIARYQTENASLAVRAIEAVQLTERITPEILSAGLFKCHWAGRMEEVLPDVFVDGAHNPDGIRAFLNTVSKDGSAKARRLIFGVVSDKDHTEMIREMAESGLFEKITVTPLATSRSADVQSILSEFGSVNGFKKDMIELATDSESALKKVLSEQDGSFRIYIAGSLYLVGEIKGIIERNGYDKF